MSRPRLKAEAGAARDNRFGMFGGLTPQERTDVTHRRTAA